MKFFKSMNEKEVRNSKKGMIFGFYTYMLISAVNYFYYLFAESSLISPVFIFWSGLLAFFVYEFILNLKGKFPRKSN